MSVEAVVFDLDGVLLDSELAWSDAKRELVVERGGHWRDSASTAMLGMSSPEWASYLRDELGVPMDPDEISPAVVAKLAARYRRALPLVDGAVEAVRRLGARLPLGLATSSDRPIVDLFLELTGLRDVFAATVTSDEAGRGKPAPDVYLQAAEALAVAPRDAAAVEDSTNGILSARAAGMHVVAVPNRDFPPQPDVLAEAELVLGSLDELTLGTVERL